MNRRDTVLALMAFGTTPFSCVAQQQDKVWRVGVLVLTSRTVALAPGFFIGGFPRGMRERGYVEGKNLSIEWRFADGDLARLTGLAADIVQSRPDVILAAGQAGIRAVRIVLISSVASAGCMLSL